MWCSCNYVIKINNFWTLTCYKIITFLSNLLEFYHIFVLSQRLLLWRSYGAFRPLFIISKKMFLLISYHFFVCKFNVNNLSNFEWNGTSIMLKIYHFLKITCKIILNFRYIQVKDKNLTHHPNVHKLAKNGLILYSWSCPKHLLVCHDMLFLNNFW